MTREMISGPMTLANGKSLPLSKAIRAGDFVFLSGQLGLDEAGKLADGIAPQTEHCLRNIRELLASADLTFEHIVKATVWLTDVGDFAAFNQIYAAAFSAAPPVRSTVCSGLMLPGALIEIEVVAYGHAD
jgi:2-iminobutanoate/2-iminopropanoate deaminase